MLGFSKFVTRFMLMSSYFKKILYNWKGEIFIYTTEKLRDMIERAK